MSEENIVNEKDYNELCRIRNDLEDILTAKKLLQNLKVVKDVEKYFKMDIEGLDALTESYTRKMINLAKKDKGLREAIMSGLLVCKDDK